MTVGPSTENQLVALRSLEGIALAQAAAVPDLREPPAAATGRSTGRLAGPAARHRRPGQLRPGASGRWPLACLLVLQALLSLRLTWSTTAFEDEALYLWAGHMEWAHWLHGAPVPPFATWFSGAPVLYPALAAVADSAGGLAAARVLSLLFMTGVTCFLWGTARRLVGDRAALISSALFVTLAGTAFLGAFATYDALALLLLAAGTWLAVRASLLGPAAAAGSGLLAGAILALACAVKYASALFVPLALLIVALAAWRDAGRMRALTVLAATAGGLIASLAVGLAAGGHDYWAGIMVTTLARPPAASSPLSVLKLSYLWTALIAVLALASLFIARRERPASRWLLAALALAVLLVPAEQARVDTTVSLHKHVVFGAWFAAMAAGYVLARLSLVDKTRGWAAVVSIPVLAALLLDGLPQATSLFRVWPNATPIVTALPGLLARHPGRYLTSSDLYQVLGYYDGGRASWPQWQSDLHFQVPGAPAGLASDRAAITSGYFSLVIIGPEGGAGTAVDQAVRADMRRAGGYRLVADADGFEAWTPAAAS